MGEFENELGQGLLNELNEYFNDKKRNSRLTFHFTRIDYIRALYLSLWSSTLPSLSGIFIVLIGLVELLISSRIKYLSETEIARKVNSIRNLIKNRGILNSLTFEELTHWRQCDTALVFEGQNWRRIPINLMLKNNIVDPESSLRLKDNCILGNDGKYRMSISMLGVELKELLNYSNNMPPTLTRNITWEEWIQILSLFYSIICLLFFPQNFIVVLIVSSTLWRSLWLLYGNCRLSLLAKVLNSSKSPYEREEVDQFDELAPPPTLNISLNRFSICKDMLSTLLGNSEVTLLHDLSSCLANATFLAFVDKRGLLSHEYPLPSEIISTDVSESAIRIEEIQLNLLHSRIFLGLSNEVARGAMFKMLGFSILATSNCRIDKKFPCREAHCSPMLADKETVRLSQFSMCTCFIAKEAGFDLRQLDGYVKMKEFILEGSSVLYKIFKLKQDGSHHLFSLGPLKSILKACRYSWNAENIQPINSALSIKFEDFEQRLTELDTCCLAFSYAPLINCTQSDLELTTNESLQKCLKRQIFLGAITFIYEPRNDLQEVISDLENSGVRFVFFSAHPEVPTKLFGSRLGLDTTWNSCIILSQDPDSSGNDPYLSNYSDPKSKLPRGIKNIRPHLQDVDDIPLHLSLFAEATPDLAAEMLSIYRENDETPIAIGSSLCPQNIFIFSKAITSIVMCPVSTDNLDETSPIKLSKVSSQLTSILSPISLSFDSSPYVFTELLRESRQVYLAIVVSTAQRLYGLLYLALASPLVPSSYAMGSFVFFAALMPAMSIYEVDIMRLMSKRPFINDLWITYNMFCCSICVAAFLLVLLGKFIIQAKNLTLCATGLSLSVVSLLFHPYRSVFQLGLQYNVACWACLLAIMLIICYLESFQLHDTAVALAFAIIMTGVGEYIKCVWRRKVLLHERRSRLLFNTKLGMHSPV